MQFVVGFVAFIIGSVVAVLSFDGPGNALLLGAMAGVLAALVVRISALSQRVNDLQMQLDKTLPAPAVLTLDDETPVQATASTPLQAHSAWTRPRVENSPSWLVRYFTEGNLIVRIGVLILLFGVGFLIKYAVERTQFPISLRLWTIVIGGGALIAVGWYFRERRRNYGLALQGGGLGVIYLVLYSAVQLYNTISPGIALMLMISLVVLGCAMSLRQNAQILAGLALAGGFLAPVLTSTGEGNSGVLFSYYLLLNIGIAALAWFRSWRTLNLLGFAFTFVIAVAWGVFDYQSDHYLITQLFVIAFFLLYVAIAVMFSQRQAAQLDDLIDGTLVFGVPAVTFFIQSALLEETVYGLAWSTAVLALFYGVVAYMLNRRAAAAMSGLIQAFTWLATGFATLTIPLALGELWTSAIWALEGLGLLWVGVRQKQHLAVISALVLFIGSGMAMLYELDVMTGHYGPLVMSLEIFGSLLIIVTATIGSRLLTLHMHKGPDWWGQLAWTLAGYGVFWLSILLLRLVFMLTDMRWTADAIMSSVIAQATLSIAWSVLGLMAAIYANRGGSREIWRMGAGLIGVVVVKLFIVDLAGTGTLGRVVSFLGVGGLLLLVGYFAPLPPQPVETAPENDSPPS